MQLLPVPEHRDPADRVRTISDRSRQIGEHPARCVHRDTPIGADQRLRDPVDQTGALGHLPQQTHPGMRHHTGTIRADHNPTTTLATVHAEGASPVGPPKTSQP